MLSRPILHLLLFFIQTERRAEVNKRLKRVEGKSWILQLKNSHPYFLQETRHHRRKLFLHLEALLLSSLRILPKREILFSDHPLVIQTIRKREIGQREKKRINSGDKRRKWHVRASYWRRDYVACHSQRDEGFGSGHQSWSDLSPDSLPLHSQSDRNLLCNQMRCKNAHLTSREQYDGDWW